MFAARGLSPRNVSLSWNQETANVEENLRKSVLTILLFALFGPAGASAIPIVVENSSFESVACPGSPDCIDGAFGSFTQGVVPGWNSAGTGDSGVYNPLGITFDPGFPSDGFQSGYGNVDSSLTQGGITTIVDGVMYTLAVDVGRRFDSCCSTLDFSVSLTADGAAVAIADESDISGGLPGVGDFGTLTLSFMGSAATSGQSLGIELASFSNQTNWDNVRLSDSTVPEPTSVTLLGLGLVGLGIFSRCR